VVAVSVGVVSTNLEDPPAPPADAAVTDAAVPDLGVLDLGVLGEVLDDWAAVLDRLHGFDSAVLSDAALEHAIQRVVGLERRAPGGRGALVWEAMMRALPAVRRFRTPGMWLRALVRCSAAEGNGWARQAEALQPRPPISGGEVLPPQLPETAKAVAEGRDR